MITSMKNATTETRMRFGILALTAATMALTGCAGINSSTANNAPTKIGFAAIKGKVIGGQNPIGFATLQVYQAGTTGYGTGSTPLILRARTTLAERRVASPHRHRPATPASLRMRPARSASRATIAARPARRSTSLRPRAIPEQAPTTRRT